MRYRAFTTAQELLEVTCERGPVRPLPMYGIVAWFGQFRARCVAAWAVLWRRAAAVRWYG